MSKKEFDYLNRLFLFSKSMYNRSLVLQNSLANRLELTEDEMGFLIDEQFNHDEGTFESFIEKIGGEVEAS